MMLHTRPLEESDLVLLQSSLDVDEYHTSTPAAFFGEPGTVCNVYEDDQGPVAFVRGAMAMRLDVQFVDNRDTTRNRPIVEQGLTQLIEQARANGFAEVVFCSASPLLARFCKRVFGFEEVAGELRKRL